MYVFVHVYVCVPWKCGYPECPEEGFRSPWAGVIGEQAGTGAGKQTQVPCKSRTLLTAEPPLQSPRVHCVVWHVQTLDTICSNHFTYKKQTATGELFFPTMATVWEFVLWTRFLGPDQGACQWLWRTSLDVPAATGKTQFGSNTRKSFSPLHRTFIHCLKSLRKSVMSPADP